MYDRYLRETDETETETEFDSDEAAAHNDKWNIMKIVKDFFSWFQLRDWRVTVLDPTRCDHPDLSDVVFYVGEPQKAALVLKLNGSSVTHQLSRDGLSAILFKCSGCPGSTSDENKWLTFIFISKQCSFWVSQSVYFLCVF